jgi:putative membrane protein
MNILKNISFFLIIAATLVLGAMFAVQNTATVPLDLLVVSLSERSIALWVLLAFGAGGVIGMLTSMGLVLRLRTESMRLRRQLGKQLDANTSLTAAAEAAAAPESEPEPETPQKES